MLINHHVRKYLLFFFLFLNRVQYWDAVRPPSPTQDNSIPLYSASRRRLVELMYVEKPEILTPLSPTTVPC